LWGDSDGEEECALRAGSDRGLQSNRIANPNPIRRTRSKAVVMATCRGIADAVCRGTSDAILGATVEAAFNAGVRE